jgi:methylated-DNA-protein-cysteine methyltransferase-like protein
MPKKSPFAKSVLEVVRAIPEGFVATYGDVATWVGRARAARAVGSVLRGLSEHQPDVPWHRVINAKGMISMGGTPNRALRQRNLLQSEGIRFDRKGRLSLSEHRWEPDPEQVEEWIARFELGPEDFSF